VIGWLLTMWKAQRLQLTERRRLRDQAAQAYRAAIAETDRVRADEGRAFE